MSFRYDFWGRIRSIMVSDLLLACILSLVPSALALNSSAAYPEVQLVHGKVIGTQLAVQGARFPVNRFLGIPYQKTPPERFGIPKSAEPWPQPLRASTFKPACIQQYTSSFLSQFALASSSRPEESEDCLYINVWQPGDAPSAEGWPVMVWIHGGGLQFGSANEAAYDGALLAGLGVVLVSFNYRLTAFGFPGSPELPLNQTNLGFLDQRFALRWIQDNISRFAGDPSRVTLFGESSGAVSIDYILTSPPATSLFEAAILQSGTGLSNTLSSLSTDPRRAWNSLVEGVDCTSAPDKLSCVRSKPAGEIRAFINKNETVFAPVEDELTLTKNVTGARLSGRASRVPLLIGTNRNEGTLFTEGQTNLTEYVSNTFGIIPAVASTVLKSYAVGQPDTKSDVSAIAQVFGDVGLHCPAAVVANQSVQAGNPTWRYLFNLTPPGPPQDARLGVYHSSELPLVFGTFAEQNSTAQEYTLSSYMRSAWAEFARAPHAGPGWNPVRSYSGNDLAVLGSLDSAGVYMVSSRDYDHRCDLYKSLYALVSQ